MSDYLLDENLAHQVCHQILEREDISWDDWPLMLNLAFALEHVAPTHAQLAIHRCVLKLAHRLANEMPYLICKCQAQTIEHYGFPSSKALITACLKCDLCDHNNWVKDIHRSVPKCSCMSELLLRLMTQRVHRHGMDEASNTPWIVEIFTRTCIISGSAAPIKYFCQHLTEAVVPLSSPDFLHQLSEDQIIVTLRTRVVEAMLQDPDKNAAIEQYAVANGYVRALTIIWKSKSKGK